MENIQDGARGVCWRGCERGWNLARCKHRRIIILEQRKNRLKQSEGKIEGEKRGCAGGGGGKERLGGSRVVAGEIERARESVVK